MTTSKKIASGILAVLAATCTTVVAAGPASAAVSPEKTQVCDPGGQAGDGYWYNISHSPKFLPSGDPDARVYGTSGTNISISTAHQFGVNASLQTTATAEAGVVFAQLSASVGASVGASKSVTTTIGGSWTVPADQPRGWLEIGSAGYQINWEKGTYSTPCTFNAVDSGASEGATGSAEFVHS